MYPRYSVRNEKIERSEIELALTRLYTTLQESVIFNTIIHDPIYSRPIEKTDSNTLQMQKQIWKHHKDGVDLLIGGDNYVHLKTMSLEDLRIHFVNNPMPIYKMREALHLFKIAANLLRQISTPASTWNIERTDRHSGSTFGGKPQYHRRREAGAKSRSRDSLDDSSDEEFETAYKTRKMAEIRTVKPVYEAIEDFLASTKAPYVLIGGKAATYYLEKQRNSSVDKRALQVARSTNDFDVLLREKDEAAFFQSMTEALGPQLRNTLEVR